MTINNPNTITTKKFKFTNANIKSLPANPANSSSTELEVSDTEIIGLKCLSGKTGNKDFGTMVDSLDDQKDVINWWAERLAVTLSSWKTP